MKKLLRKIIELFSVSERRHKGEVSMKNEKKSGSAFSFKESLLELFLTNTRPTVSAQSYSSGVLYCRKKYSGIFSDDKGNWPSVYISQRSTFEKEKK